VFEALAGANVESGVERGLGPARLGPHAKVVSPRIRLARYCGGG
jgi:hypothetical protein